MAEAPKSGNQAATKASELMESAKTTAEAVQVKVAGAAENVIDATKTKFQSSGEPAEGAAEKKKDHSSAADHKEGQSGGDGGLMDKAKSLFTK